MSPIFHIFHPCCHLAGAVEALTRSNANTSIRLDMPKRRSLQPPLLQIEDVPCAVLGKGIVPVPIPKFQEHGLTCVALNSTDSWLNRVVSDRTRGEATQVLKEFIEGVIAEVKRILSDRNQDKERSLPSDPTAGSEPPNARRAMGLDNDSDEEELAEMPMVDCKRARGVKNTPAPRAELTTISS